MAGLWDRIATRGAGSSPLPSSVLRAVVYLVARGVVTGAQARDAVNAQLGNRWLTPAEIDDLTGVLAQIALQPSAAEKMDYLERFHALTVCAEAGVLRDENVWRTQLNIA